MTCILQELLCFSVGVFIPNLNTCMHFMFALLDMVGGRFQTPYCKTQNTGIPSGISNSHKMRS